MNSELDPAAQLYHGTSGRVYHEGKRELRPEALPWLLALRAEKFQRHLRASDVVVELGVGAGWNLGALKCARRIGCDTSEFLADRVKTLGVEFVSDLSAVPDSIADAAICHHTLEHLLEPSATMKQLARVLKPGGKLILHVPWDRERRFANYRADEPNHHLYTWNAQNLGNLVSVLGFKVESVGVRRYGYDRFAANLSASLRTGETGFRVLRAVLVALKPLREVALIATKAKPSSCV